MTSPVPALPNPTRADGEPRRVGVEVEFSGLDEHTAAGIFADAIGGAPVSEEDGGVHAVESARFGTCAFYLDTRYRDDLDKVPVLPAKDLARRVVPVELATDPFDPADLGHFQTGLAALRRAGATGSRDGLLLGFGFHLNVEIASPDAADLWRTLTAYALIEDLLRASLDVDISRRALPFIAPYPTAMTTDLVSAPITTRDALVELYLHHAPTRNHGLDMLPILAHLAPRQVRNRIEGGTETKPRPAWHFRLPDCRIDEPGWSIFDAWSAWRAVENLAAAPALFDALRQAWLYEHSNRLPTTRRHWTRKVASILDAPQEIAS